MNHYLIAACSVFVGLLVSMWVCGMLVCFSVCWFVPLFCWSACLSLCMCMLSMQPRLYSNLLEKALLPIHSFHALSGRRHEPTATLLLHGCLSCL